MFPALSCLVGIWLLAAHPSAATAREAARALPARQNARIVDGIVAKVNGEPLFLREMRMAYWLGGGTAGGGGRSPEDLLQSTIDRKILLQEARRLRMTVEPDEPLSPQLIARAERLAARPGVSGKVGPIEIQKWVAGEESIRRLKENRIGLLISISSQAIEEYHRAHRDDFGNGTSSQVKAQIERKLHSEAFEREYGRWFGSLRNRSQVEVFVKDKPWKEYDFRAYFEGAP